MVSPPEPVSSASSSTTSGTWVLQIEAVLSGLSLSPSTMGPTAQAATIRRTAQTVALCRRL